MCASVALFSESWAFARARHHDVSVYVRSNEEAARTLPSGPGANVLFVSINDRDGWSRPLPSGRSPVCSVRCLCGEKWPTIEEGHGRTKAAQPPSEPWKTTPQSFRPRRIRASLAAVHSQGPRPPASPHHQIPLLWCQHAFQRAWCSITALGGRRTPPLLRVSIRVSCLWVSDTELWPKARWMWGRCR